MTASPTTLLLQRPLQLPTGRTLSLESQPAGTALMIRSANSEVEVEILLTDTGPVVRLNAAALELVAADNLTLRTHRLRIECQDTLQLAVAKTLQLTAEELRAKTERSIHLNGETIRLNCTDDAEPAPVATRPTPSQDAITDCCEKSIPKPTESTDY